MSMIVEQAGGMAITGTDRVLDVVPKSIHERVSIFLGCKRDVRRVKQLYDAHTESNTNKRSRVET